MTRKTEIKAPNTLDSLLESKEQTDKALADLADSLREKLRRLEAVIGSDPATPETADSRRQTAADTSGAGAPLLPSAICRLLSPNGKQFWTWFWRIVAFIVMSVLIWGALALLKEPKANGDMETADCKLQTAADASGAGAPLLQTAVCRLPSPYPGEPVEGFEKESGERIKETEEESQDNGEESTGELLTPDSLLLSPSTTQRPRIRLFQRRQ